MTTCGRLRRPSSQRSSQCILNRPTEAKPFGQRGRTKTKAPPPLCQGRVFAAVLDDVVCSRHAAIQSLFSPRCPANVTFGVGAIVVDSVERVCRRRSSSNIADEGLETSGPFRTHRDTSGPPALGAPAFFFFFFLFLFFFFFFF